MPVGSCVKLGIAGMPIATVWPIGSCIAASPVPGIGIAPGKPGKPGMYGIEYHTIWPSGCRYGMAYGQPGMPPPGGAVPGIIMGRLEELSSPAAGTPVAPGIGIGVGVPAFH